MTTNSSGEKYQFHIDCVHARGADILAMTDGAREISFATFARRCNTFQLLHDLGYAVAGEKGLHVKDDYHVSFYRSRYRGRCCYYMDQSSIEYVFTHPPEAPPC